MKISNTTIPDLITENNSKKSNEISEKENITQTSLGDKKIIQKSEIENTVQTPTNVDSMKDIPGFEIKLTILGLLFSIFFKSKKI